MRWGVECDNPDLDGETMTYKACGACDGCREEQAAVLCSEPDMHMERRELFGYCPECQSPDGLPRGQFYAWCAVCNTDTPQYEDSLPVAVDHDPQNDRDARHRICTVCDTAVLDDDEPDFAAMAQDRAS